MKNRKDQYLVIQRAKEGKPTDGKWDIPGGRIDVGVALMENLSRELREEIGLENLDLSSATLLCAQDILQETIHVVRLTYLLSGDFDHFTPKLSHEHVRYRWTSLDALKNLVSNDVVTLAGTNHL